MVDGRCTPDVPGVGRHPAAALAHVAAQSVEGVGAEQVGRLPGATLGAVDGAGPGMGQVWRGVVSETGNEPSGQQHLPFLEAHPQGAVVAGAITVPTEPLCRAPLASRNRACNRTRSPAA